MSVSLSDLLKHAGHPGYAKDAESLEAQLREAKEANAQLLQQDTEWLEKCRALRAENEALREAVVELREWVSTTAQHPSFCGANWSKVGSYAADTCTCGKVDILVSTARLVTNDNAKEPNHG